MHTVGDRNPIGRDDIQFKRVLIDLGEQGRSRNGERKRFGGFCAREGAILPVRARPPVPVHFSVDAPPCAPDRRREV